MDTALKRGLLTITIIQSDPYKSETFYDPILICHHKLFKFYSLDRITNDPIKYTAGDTDEYAINSLTSMVRSVLRLA